MSKRILICSELSVEELRQASFKAATPRERKRMLAIALVMEGTTRPDAGRQTDQSDQAVIDAIKRYNAEGLAGLADRPRVGRPRKLDAAQRAELHAIALEGPDVEAEHLSAYTREDLANIVQKKWRVTYDVTSIGRMLREMKMSRQKMRPSHPKRNQEAVEAFLKNARPA
jgi:transposase